MSATRALQASLVVLVVLVLLGAGSAWGQTANLTFTVAGDANHILLNGTTPFIATVGNAAGSSASMDWSVNNDNTSGLTLSGTSVSSLAAGGTATVSGSYTGSTYGNFAVLAQAIGTNNPGGGPAIHSPATASFTITVGWANASSGEANSLFNFNASNALYSLVQNNGSMAGLASKVVSGESNFLGTVGTILWGFNHTGSDQLVSMNWRSRSLVETDGGGTTPGTPGSPIMAGEYGSWSDAAEISMPAATTYVLQLTYDANTLRLENGHDEQWYAARGDIYLAWIDPLDDMLKNAVLGNSTLTGNKFMGDSPWNGGDANYTTLGHYGVDSVSNTVWAVLDHSSVFEATPEPTTMAILAVTGLALLRRRNRK